MSEKEILKSILNTAKSNQYVSYDVSDLQNHKGITLIKNNISNFKIKKFMLRVFNYLGTLYPKLIRFVFCKKNNELKYPQAFAMIIRTHISLLIKNNPMGNLEECELLSNWLLKNRSTDQNKYSWGQPFLWYSNKPFPPNLPRATVTSQVAWAMIDLYCFTKKSIYLEAACNCCEFFLNDLNYTLDKDGDFCFSYTTIDNYQVHNASLLAASVLSRVGVLTNNFHYKNMAYKAVCFSIKHQEPNGSWTYGWPSEKFGSIIDNYHTGFNLESLATIYEDTKSELIKNSYIKGLEYYYNNLFDGDQPKHTNQKLFPLDIQGCAQSIITFSQASNIDEKYKIKSKEILNFTINKLYIKEKAHFGYRIYKNGFYDQNYYLRWGDAWMMKAISNTI